MTTRKSRPSKPRSGARRSRSRTSRPRNWEAVIERLNRSPSGEMRIRMGSPGSAQVTRVRLLADWNNLEATTVGPDLYLSLRK